MGGSPTHVFAHVAILMRRRAAEECIGELRRSPSTARARERSGPHGGRPSFGSRPQVTDFRERLLQSGALLGQHPDAVMSG
ncbi:hypothetical protein E1267_23925 [Nonomuraea longispora]|uniref:Uncharacterized protein n=1 Tax=Nonomuraea longispora TaxID=1848320 RepID=A0A4R4NBX6_9ACTN|nr:hypothetical protein [Nonomuraea longispora]TDC04112.1 hypothetical protein E1267_23925 [Nonomuraea longispora]